jgi:hypothetical protein
MKNTNFPSSGNTSLQGSFPQNEFEMDANLSALHLPFPFS